MSVVFLLLPGSFLLHKALSKLVNELLKTLVHAALHFHDTLQHVWGGGGLLYHHIGHVEVVLYHVGHVGRSGLVENRVLG